MDRPEFFTSKAFKPVKFKVYENEQGVLEGGFRVPDLTSLVDMMSLEEIILAQLDEPKHSERIYKVRSTDRGSFRPGEKVKYTHIRVKSIEFMEEEATAIYFNNYSHHMRSQELQFKYLEQIKEN